jgi:hypothetical protein
MDLKKLAVVVFLIALVMFGCTSLLGESSPGSSGSAYGESDTGVVKSYSSQVYSTPSTSSSSSTGQYITKESSITVKVKEGTLEEKFTETTTRLRSEGADVSKVYYDEYSDRKQYTMTVKVLPAKFDSINSFLKQIGEVKDMSVQLDDVTKQYTDLDTRIKNKETELDRLYVLYNKSSNVSDLLDVEREVTRVETELELLKQQKQSVISKIEKSAITVIMYEEKPASQQLSISLDNIAPLFFGAFSAAILLVVAVGGFLLPIIAVLAILWFIYKKLTEEKKPKPRQPEHSRIPSQQ